MITLFCIHPKGFNVGNDVIQLGLRHFLDEAFGEEEVVNLIALPASARYESQAKAGLTAKTVYEINQYGQGVIIGGGNLYENGQLNVDLDALKCLEVPAILYSLSRGRVYNRRRELVPRTDSMPDRVISALHEKARHSLARDRATLDYLQGIGCRQGRLGGCPTLYLDLIADQLPYLPQRGKSGVLISVRNPELMSIPLEKRSQVYHDVVEIIRFFRKETPWEVRLLCHDHRDIPFAASISGVDFVYTGDVYSYLAMLRSASLSVSYRLHAVLPCLSFGTPTIKISYDERALSLLETIGLGSWNIDMVQHDDAPGQVIDRYRRLDELHSLCDQAQATWDDLYTVNLGVMKSFANDVVSCRQQSTRDADTSDACQSRFTSSPKRGPIIRAISA